jgi:dTDP-4-dehydrorhamnose 3,5-epimerase
MPTSKYGLEGVDVHDVTVLPDERGVFSEILRQDWKEFLRNEWIAQANLSYSYPGVVRAWHRHMKGQVDYFLVIKGSMKICAYDDAAGSPNRDALAEITVNEDRLQLVRIPGLYWHGTKTVGYKPSLTVYFVTRIYDYKNPDEERRPWDDPKIVPSGINGKANDPRVGKPWDWFFPVHK